MNTETGGDYETPEGCGDLEEPPIDGRCMFFLEMWKYFGPLTAVIILGIIAVIGAGIYGFKIRNDSGGIIISAVIIGLLVIIILVICLGPFLVKRYCMRRSLTGS